MPALEPALKKAIVAMPSADKDKLLLRLIAKDAILIERLQFELLEEGQTLLERRELIKDFTQRAATVKADTAGWMMMDMRTVSGYITRHVKVTKDAYGDVELTLYMLNTFYRHNAHLLKHLDRRTENAAEYIAKRTQQVLKKLEKLDPDYYIEFAGDVNTLLGWVYQTAPGFFAKTLGIPARWHV